MVHQTTIKLSVGCAKEEPGLRKKKKKKGGGVEIVTFSGEDSIGTSYTAERVSRQGTLVPDIWVVSLLQKTSCKGGKLPRGRGGKSFGKVRESSRNSSGGKGEGIRSAQSVGGGLKQT